MTVRHMLTTMDETKRARLFGGAQAAGATVLGSRRYDVSETGAFTLAGQLLSLAVVGEANAHVTHIEVVSFQRGPCRLAYVVPFQNAYDLAGVYHTLLPGTYEQPVAFLPGLIGGHWHANHDAALVKQLKDAPGLTKAVKALPFAHRAHYGSTPFEWVVQLGYVGEGQSHLVVKSGTRHLDINHQCVEAAFATAAALAALLQPATSSSPVQGHYYDVPYVQLAYESLAG